ncbi:DUF2231 domain-containing protein [Kaarinaea lacus]
MEIIPNWHPIFVHFTVALFSVAALVMLASYVLGSVTLRDQLRLVARWNIWIGAVFVALTVLSGLIAYNTVNHDTPSHLAMTNHRNWALVTSAVFLVLAIWLAATVRAGKATSGLFVVLLLAATGLLGVTAWKGGELVYRYGLGVMSLPKADTHGHADGEAHDHGTGTKAEHDNSDGHHDNSDGHHDEKSPVSDTDSHSHDSDSHDNGSHDNSDGHHDTLPTESVSSTTQSAPKDDHFADGHTH